VASLFFELFLKPTPSDVRLVAPLPCRLDEFDEVTIWAWRD